MNYSVTCKHITEGERDIERKIGKQTERHRRIYIIGSHTDRWIDMLINRMVDTYKCKLCVVVSVSERTFLRT